MILANGTIYDSSRQQELLCGLEAEINRTRETGRLLPETVIRAVEALVEQLLAGVFEERIEELSRSGLPGMETIREQLAQALPLLQREHLEYRLRTELGSEKPFDDRGDSNQGQKRLRICMAPLGTLFHIAAGNMDGLPVYSVLEGLLAGNVNILKLPQADKGLSVEILVKLLEIEPKLAPYIYVFDTPSEDIGAMRQMADMSDGIAIWGSDEAVRAVRQMAGPGTRLIEWGHKLGFAYLSGYEDKERELGALAEHIVKTGQLLCSSCQTIFLDCEEMAEVYAFCEEFLPYLQAAADRHAGRGADTVGARAETALRRYSDRIEEILAAGKSETEASGERRRLWGRGCSLTAAADSELELSDLFGNCLVKRLPRSQIFSSLRRHKGHLQTVGLICEKEKREELTKLFAACGLVRIMRAGSQSDSFEGEAHDGEYPLMRYVRIVNVEP